MRCPWQRPLVAPVDPLYGVKMGRDASGAVCLDGRVRYVCMYVVGIDVGMYDVIAVPRLDRSVVRYEVQLVAAWAGRGQGKNKVAFG